MRRENDELRQRLAEAELQLQASNSRIVDLQLAEDDRHANTTSPPTSQDSGVNEMRESLISCWQERQSASTQQDVSIGWAISDHLKAMLAPRQARMVAPMLMPTNYSSKQFDAHLIICAVKHGWESIRSQTEHDPQWQFLCSILDGNLLSDLDRINKLPGLLAVRRMMNVSAQRLHNTSSKTDTRDRLCKVRTTGTTKSLFCLLTPIQREYP